MDKYKINFIYDERSYNFYDLIDDLVEQFVKEKLEPNI